MDKYKINDNNTSPKHEFKVKYDGYERDISKDTLQL
jgi:hypothetical protein